MKYGNQLERESVPEWSLHNLDYNSLKHEIKVHTTRHQATAMAIPGHQDAALNRFEESLYLELCRQHDRVDLFISSKADEISRRLDHLDASLHRWAAKCADEPSSCSVSLKRQRRFVKYERELLKCNQDIQALFRFANAQIIAFRKILKKYRKWTGSMALSARFNDSVLSHPKSFTRRDFSGLKERHDDIMITLNSATPQFSDPGSPSSLDIPHISERTERVAFKPLPPAVDTQQFKYWNEYDDGSETGGAEEDYAIYINPDEATSFPGLAYMQSIIAIPFTKAKRWFHVGQRTHEHQSLLSSPPPTSHSYGSMTTANVDSDEEGYASSDNNYGFQGYAHHYAFPSVDDQRMRRYRERVLLWGTAGCFAASFVLLTITSVLISTGKRKLRVEVDAGVTVGVVVSLFCACSGLGMTLYREDPLPLLYRLMVWSTFIVVCLLNGMLLVLVAENSP